MTTPRKLDTKRGGFTLVEIMIVVLIIGILLAVAVPTWVSRRQEARVTTVIADLVAIESAKTRYIAETGQVSTAAVAVGDLVPTYIKVWPKGPFMNPSDYVPNPGDQEPTFKGVTAATLQNSATKAAAVTALGL